MAGPPPAQHRPVGRITADESAIVRRLFHACEDGMLPSGRAREAVRARPGRARTDGPGARIHDERSIAVRRHGPAHDMPGKQVRTDRDIEPAISGLAGRPGNPGQECCPRGPGRARRAFRHIGQPIRCSPQASPSVREPRARCRARHRSGHCFAPAPAYRDRCESLVPDRCGQPSLLRNMPPPRGRALPSVPAGAEGWGRAPSHGRAFRGGIPDARARWFRCDPLRGMQPARKRAFPGRSAYDMP